MRKFSKRAKGRWKDISGEKFGRLVAKHPSGNTRDHGPLWYCECRCGNFTTVLGASLRSGATRSCGCLFKETRRTTGLANRTHGKTDTTEYNLWQSMRARCKNPKVQSYKYYGGRGIKVCAGWDAAIGFVHFFKTLGTRPSPAHSLDRMEVDGHYSCGECAECVANGWPLNVRWATRPEQAANKRTSRLHTWQGKRMTLGQIAVDARMKYDVLKYRVNVLKMPIWKAVSQLVVPPVRIFATINGETKQVSEWIRILKVKATPAAVYIRIRGGESPEQALVHCYDVKGPFFVTFKGKLALVKQHARENGVDYGAALRRYHAGQVPEEIFAKSKFATLMLTYKKRTQSLRDWAKEVGGQFASMWWRFKQGWSPQEILYGRARS